MLTRVSNLTKIVKQLHLKLYLDVNLSIGQFERQYINSFKGIVNSTKLYYEILNIKVGWNTTEVILLTTWYFGHTGWSRFQTDQSTTQVCHLKENDVKFQWSVFIFQNRDLHTFVLAKFPLFVQHFILSIPDFFSIIVPTFNLESFGV